MAIEYMFCFVCSEQCINIISSRKKCGYSSVFKKLFLIMLPLLFKKCGGYFTPHVLSMA